MNRKASGDDKQKPTFAKNTCIDVSQANGEAKHILISTRHLTTHIS